MELNDVDDLILTLSLGNPFIPGYDIGSFLIMTLLTIGIIIAMRKKDEF